MTMKDYIELDHYKLWADGTVTVDDNQLENIITNGVPLNRVYVEKKTPKVVQWNKFSGQDEKFDVKTNLSPFSVDWNIPDEYVDIDIVDYISNELIPKVEQDEFYDARLTRIVEEVEQIQITKSESIFRCLIYILDKMKKDNVFWGLGRGSSCSVYLFYLLELHAVDCVKYDIHYSEFFKGSAARSRRV